MPLKDIDRIFSWGNGRRFNSYPDYFRKIFGTRVQKVSVDAGFTCPNRDGTKGKGGCTYCLNDAFNPSYCTPQKPVKRQLEEGILFHKTRYRKALFYVAYFQAYSNTYAPLDILKERFSEALSFPGVIGIIIGTRPDCIDNEKLEYLRELSGKYYVAVEYGIESCYDKTLTRINRCHNFADAVNALEATASLGINTGAHFIFGLPGETREEMLKQSEIISELPLTTVKFHQLQIIKGTGMEEEFRVNPGDFHLFDWEGYLAFIVDFLERLNPSIVVERFTGEVPPRFVNDMGWGRKRTDHLLSLIEKRFLELDTWQGRLYEKRS